MSYEMQQLMLKEVMKELEDYDRTINRNTSKVNIISEKKLREVHAILCDNK